MNVWIFSAHFSGELRLFAMLLSQPDQYSHNSLLHFLSENRTPLIELFFFFLFVSVFLSKAFNQVAEVEKKGEGGRELDYILSTQGSCE